MIDFARLESPDGNRIAGPPPRDSSSEVEHVEARRREVARLGDEIARLSAHIQAATYRLLEMIGDFDASEGWHEEGFRSCAAWLSWRTGIAPGAAREKVRVARALKELPALSAALARGLVSYSVARAITRVATPETEAEWVETARHATAAQLERLVGGWQVVRRSPEREGENEPHDEWSLCVVPEADGSWRVKGRLGPEAGAVLCRALEAAGEALRGREPDAEVPAAARRADALGLVAEAALGTGFETSSGDRPVVGRAERFQVVVHVSAETLAGAEARGNAVGEVHGGPYVSAETSRRLACDSAVVEMTHDRDGSVLDVGRRRRTVPTPLRRVLDRRDGGCRFPGCGVRFCDAHHVQHWAEGGATRLDNLLLLCRHHHRRVHEDGWTLTLDERGEARFHRPDGRLLPNVPERSPVPVDSWADLERRQADLEIDPWTATSRWSGERLDLDWAQVALAQRWRSELDVSAETSTVEGPKASGH
jgi:hypothetical protein